ncbi:MAG: glycosyltransferase family 4 protein [Bryobacteraceae bacterium]
MPLSKTVMSVFGLDPIRIGGVETYARELSVQLATRGWKSVLCFQSAPPEPVRRFLQLENVQVEVTPDVWRPNWQVTRRVGQVLRRYRPKIVHLNFTGFLSPYAWLAKLSGVERVLFTDRTSNPEGYKAVRARLLKRLATRLISAPVDFVINPSDYGRRCWLARDLFPAERLVRIHNSVDFRRNVKPEASFRRRFGIPENRTLVVQVSWIRPEKGIHDLLSAARLVVDRNPNVHFAIVGDGPYRKRYMELTTRMGLPDNVTWTGRLIDPVGEGVYEAADIACQTSRWEELFGFVIAEAMAFEKPVIGTRVGGIPDLIDDGKTGFIVPRGDQRAIANRILNLVEDRDLRNAMGRAARKSAEAQFDIEKNVAEVLRLYNL